MPLTPENAKHEFTEWSRTNVSQDVEMTYYFLEKEQLSN